MNNRTQKRRMLRTCYVMTDLVTTALGILLFNMFRWQFIPDIFSNITLSAYLGSRMILLEQMLLPVLFLGVYWLSGYYNNVEEKSRLQEAMVTFSTCFCLGVAIYLIFLLNDRMGRRRLDYEMLASLIGILFVCLYSGRMLVTNIIRKHYNLKRKSVKTVIAGSKEQIRKMKIRMRGGISSGFYNICGYYIPGKKGDALSDENSSLLDYDRIKAMASSGELEQIVIASGNTESECMELLSKFFSLNVPIRIAPDSLAFINSSIRLGNVYGEPLVDLSNPHISDFSKNLKRTLDIISSGMALIVLSPLLAIVAAIVKLTSKGPVFYSQERIGLHSKPFRIYKFRSMHTDAEASGIPQLSFDEDPRTTTFGKWMRKYRIDELPQFWNVIIGDMSLVGPRPEREYFIKQIERQMPQYTLLHQIRPGVTSWGMVKYGYASNVKEMMERARFDMIYLSNMSMMMDLKIIIHTLKTIITGKGV